MALSFGLKVREVSIVPAGSLLGVCYREATDNWRVNYAIVMAGPWAGRWFDEDTSELANLHQSGAAAMPAPELSRRISLKSATASP